MSRHRLLRTLPVAVSCCLLLPCLSAARAQAAAKEPQLNEVLRLITLIDWPPTAAPERE